MECSLICRRDWTLSLAGRKRLEAFEMWIWRRMYKLAGRNM